MMEAVIDVTFTIHNVNHRKQWLANGRATAAAPICWVTLSDERHLHSILNRAKAKSATGIKKGKNRAKRTIFTRDKVSEADRGEGDDHEVDGLQRAPALDVLEDDGGQGHEDEAAEEDEEQRGEHADLCLADFPLLLGD